MLSSILFCFELHSCACFFSPPGQPLHEERRAALPPSLTGSQTAFCVVGACDWNIASRRLQFLSIPSLNVWFHSVLRDYRQRVKAYMCMCSCQEWIMYSDSRDRWIYDHQLKRIAVTLNQEVLVKSCYNSQPWTCSRSLLMFTGSSPTIGVQESFTFQQCAKWHKIASCHFPQTSTRMPSNINSLTCPYPTALSPPYPHPHPISGRWF